MKWYYILLALALTAGGGAVGYVKTKAVRNNNPGNIRKNPNFVWQGEIGVDRSGFVIFDTIENGFRALARTLKTYYNKHGLTSIEKIIYRWAPPEDNNPTDAYADYVAQFAGYAKGLYMSPATFSVLLPEIVEAIARQESGSVIIDGFYGDRLAGYIHTGVMMA